MHNLNLITIQGGGHYHFHFLEEDMRLREVKECTQGHTVGKWQTWDSHPGLDPETLESDLRSNRGHWHGTVSHRMPCLGPVHCVKSFLTFRTKQGPCLLCTPPPGILPHGNDLHLSP